MPEYQLHLTGYVGGYDFDRQYVEFVLNEYKDSPVNVLIDSLGGSLATALSIASAFQRHGNVTVHFVGMNASAATIASLGAKRVTMDSNAMYLAHKCSSEFFHWGSMNADQLSNLQDQIGQMVSDLEKMDANVAQMYATKSGKSVSNLLALMKVGGWLSAKEALDWGFVDEITEWEEAAPVLTDTTASALSAAGIPIPNIPIEGKDQPAFARFLAALTNFFTSHNNTMPNANTTPSLEEQITALQNQLKAQEDTIAALQKEAQSKDDTLAQAHKDLKAKSDEVASLTAELETLKARPAESTTHVMNDGSQPAPKSDAEEYFDTIASARTLFNALP